MDLLVYGYETNSNKLKKVTDTSNKIQGFNDGTNQTTEYVYDINGNMTSDANKGITSIMYNYLNLPTEIKFNNSNTKKINYTYSADGIKLRKVTNDNGSITTTDYANNGSVYENNALQFIPTAEGYVSPNGSSWQYVYQYRDHIDNIRLSYADGDGNGTISQSEIIEENNYQPFGLKMQGFNTNVSSLGNSVAQRYKFGGKEYDESFQSLNTYDFGARNYDPALGRWFGIDNLSEKHFNFSPYMYTANNPILFVDFDGNDFGVLVGRINRTITIRATFISNSKNSAAISKSTSKFNSKSGKVVFVAGGLKALRSRGKSANAFIINYDLDTQIDNTMESKHTSGGDRQALDDKTGTVNSFDTISGKFPRKSENVAGTAGDDQITMREDKKNTDSTDHEVSHTLGNAHVTEPDGTLPLTSTNSTISGATETLKGVGIGGNTIKRNATTAPGSGTLLNGSTNQGLESGRVISVNRYNRIVKRVERRRLRNENR